MLAAARQRLDAAICSEIDRGLIPGAVMLVQHRGRLVHRAALGEQDPQQHVAMREDSIFRIHSMTKPVVSVALMMLVEEGLLRLRDPVSEHLQEFAKLRLGVLWRDSRGRESLKRVALPPSTPSSPTEPLVHDLLRHTSGLTYGSFGNPSKVKAAYHAAGIESGRLSNAEFARRLAEVPLAYAPGTVWEYGRSTDLIGALIERLAGCTLGEFLRQRIFEPLRMFDTAFHVDVEQQHRIAEAFAVEPTSGEPIVLGRRRAPPIFESGGGGLVSTARDYLRFAQMLRGGGTLGGRRLLSPAAVRLMTSDHLGAELIRASRVAGANDGYLPGPGYGFGLGFAVRISAGEAGVPGHIGDYHWSGISGSYFWVDPVEDLIAIWMMQAPQRRHRYWATFRHLVYAAL